MIRGVDDLPGCFEKLAALDPRSGIFAFYRDGSSVDSVDSQLVQPSSLRIDGVLGLRDQASRNN